jgi:hypothetical protein
MKHCDINWYKEKETQLHAFLTSALYEQKSQLQAPALLFKRKPLNFENLLLNNWGLCLEMFILFSAVIIVLCKTACGKYYLSFEIRVFISPEPTESGHIHAKRPIAAMR